MKKINNTLIPIFDAASKYKKHIWILAVLAGAVLVFFACVWLNRIRIPCGDHSVGPLWSTTTLLSSSVFFVVIPSLYFFFHLLLGRFIGLFASLFATLLALFPYRFLYSNTTDLCAIHFDPVPQTLLGTGGWTVLLFYVFVALLATTVYWRFRHNAFFPAFERKNTLVFSFLLIIAIAQVVPRYGSNSPKSVAAGYHHEDTPNKRRVFHGVRYGGVDHHLHIDPSFMFKGAEKPATYNTLTINRRAVGPYLYSLVSTFLNPYLTIITINILFYFLIIAAGYLLSKSLGLSEAISLGFAILLSANHFVLFRTIVPYFYIQHDIVFPLVLLLGYKLKVFSPDFRLRALIPISFFMMYIGLSYDPSHVCLFIATWGLFRASRNFRHDKRASVKILVVAVSLAAIPLLAQHVWETAIAAHDLAGNVRDIRSRDALSGEILTLPRYMVEEDWDTITTLDQFITRILVINKMDTKAVEYWSLLGFLGVVALAAFVPKYVQRKDWDGIYLLVFVGTIVWVLFSIATLEPPGNRFDEWRLDAIRSNSPVYCVTVLAQSIGIYGLLDLFISHSKKRAVPVIFFIIVGAIWILSFGNLLFT